jgi:hypothetical protein
MTMRTPVLGIDIGSCGRVLYSDAPSHRLLRANETALSPETKVVIVLVL